MRFIILGAGGIGCYYGAKLQQAGHEVLFVARGKHLQALQTHGLSIKHPKFSFQQAVQACDQQQLLQEYPAAQADLIILSLKASQTASLLDELHDWLQAADTPVLSLQNGVDNEIHIAAHIGQQRTIGGLAVRIGGHIVQPGMIEATGLAQVIMGSWPQQNTSSNTTQLNAFHRAFVAAQIPSQLTPRIQYELWLKLLINNGVNPLSALTGLDTKTLTSHPVYGDTVYRLMQETAAVALADGVELASEDLERMYQLICQFDAIKTSMLVDKEKGRPLELDAISGAILRRSQQTGIAAPLTALIHNLLIDSK